MRYRIGNCQSIVSGGKTFKAVDGLFELTHEEFKALAPFNPQVALDVLVNEATMEMKKPEEAEVKSDKKAKKRG